MPHGLVSSLLQDAVDVVQGGAVLATRKFVLGSLLWAVIGGKCSLEVVGFQCRGVSGLYLLCQADHVEFTPVEVLMDQAVLHHRHEDFSEQANFLAEVLTVDPSHASAAHRFAFAVLRGRGCCSGLGEF